MEENKLNTQIAVSYARVSTNKEEQKESLIHQKEFFKEYVKRNNMILKEIYADEGISGTKTKNRKEFQRMMRDAELGMFQVLLVKDVSRLARNTFDFLKCIRRLKELGVKIVYISYGGDVFEGELVLTIMAAIAQEESHNMSRRIKFGKMTGKQKGIVPNIVYGYDKVKDDKYALSVNEDEAELVQEIFNMFTVDNKGASKIAVVLNERGFTTKRNCAWSSNGVVRILRNQIYTGRIYNGKQEVQDFLTGKRIQKEKEDWYYRQYDEIRIISDEQFQQAQALLAERADCFKLYNKKDSSKYLYSTLIKCKCCGRSFRRIDRADCKEPWYVCYNRNEKGAGTCVNRTRVIERELTEAISHYFSEFVKNKDTEIMKYAREIKKVYDKDTKSVEEVTKIEEEIARIKEERETEIEMFKMKVISSTELQERTKPMNARIEKLEKEKMCYTYNNYKVEDIAKILRKAFKSMDDISKGKNYTNEALKKILSRIEVDENGKIEIFVAPFSEIGLTETCRFSDIST